MIGFLSTYATKITAAFLANLSLLLSLGESHQQLKLARLLEDVRKTLPRMESDANQINKSLSQEAFSSGIQISRILPSQQIEGRFINLTNGENTSPLVGGPTQPEMSSFKSVGINNMVNLFSGDFSYNVPLMDVGGYPINIYYNGSVTPEEEASWVGLGWNINPGNINRNMRGVPDDFNGQDTMIQVQKTKPNKTWGLNIGGDLETFGVKMPVEMELGVAFNNYLGPSFELGVRGNLAKSIGSVGGSEKLISTTGRVSAGLNLSSRTGASFFATASHSGSYHLTDSKINGGLSLSTGYSSRSGIKALNISEQHSFNIKEKIKSSDGSDNYRDRNINGYPLFGTSISFLKPSYAPTMRLPITNKAWSGRFQIGLGVSGVFSSVEAEVYGMKSFVADQDTLIRKPMAGYLHYPQTNQNLNYMTDFTRLNDREVTPNTSIISAPQYTYDVFSIQGEGTGGSIRLYRNDIGFVRDNLTISKDDNVSAGADVGLPGHFGANFSLVKSPSAIGAWSLGNKLKQLVPFRVSDSVFEAAYFRNPGENCVVDQNRLDRLGGTDLVRYVLGGNGQSPTIEPKLQRFGKSLKEQNPIVDLATQTTVIPRAKRSQYVSYLSAGEASLVGLDQSIKSYDNQTFVDPITDTLKYQALPRVDSQVRKAHHISEVTVTERNGKRYVYGLPVYNLSQIDYSFSVTSPGSQLVDMVDVTDNQMSAQSVLLSESNTSHDGFFQKSITPPFAHSYLLTGILSSDYVDVSGNGITEDDLGAAVKFNYSRISQPGYSGHKWRSPMSSGDMGIFNSGNRSEKKDDKAMVSFGVRESWYVHSIESKSMIAFFYLSDRLDGKGPINERGGIDGGEKMVKKLDSIALYNKAEVKARKLSGARPIKTVIFRYSYNLCKNTPDNKGLYADSTGKLTLDSILFVYNGARKAVKSRYSFYYTEGGVYNTDNNPNYAYGQSDRWGNYKPASANPGGLKNNDYPYTLQDSLNRNQYNKYASAWLLKRIVIPSGAEIEVNYEMDDYAFVQNKRASAMMQIVGFGTTPFYSQSSNRLYQFFNNAVQENDHVFIQVPKSCANANEIKSRYLQDFNQLSFKVWVNMPKGPELIPCYARYESWDTVAGQPNIIRIKLARINGKSPISLSVLEYLRQQLPGQAFEGYDVSGDPEAKKIWPLLLTMLAGLKDAFRNPIDVFRASRKGMYTDLSKSFVRLTDPDGCKFGGGNRVKSIVMKDNWNKMTKQFTSSYGKIYTYRTTELFNGSKREISSGVASYEPGMGGEENPFQSIIEIQDRVPMGPTSYGAIEMPMLDAFFPAPQVGYSKVTVRSIKRDTVSNVKTRSGVGRQITEFYTARDFPVQYSYTPLDASATKEFSQKSVLNFWEKYDYDYKAHSQGFLVINNDMHGKIKSQSSYPENDTASRVSYQEYFYKNTGIGGSGDQFLFVQPETGGTVFQGNMGIDVELMTDTREFALRSYSTDFQGQVDIIYMGPPITTFWQPNGLMANIYRAVTVTKVVDFHGVVDSMVVIDKGSMVSTKNLAYDANTGDVLVTRTNNIYNKPVYNAEIPAYWAYSGMEPACKNADAQYTNVRFSDGKVISPVPGYVFEAGDELLIRYSTKPMSGCDSSLQNDSKLKVWAIDRNKQSSSLANAPDIVFLDSVGKQFTRSNVSFRIVRSGKRNMLEDKIASFTTLNNPLATGKLVVDSSTRVIASSALEFRERWLIDNDVLKRVKTVIDTATCLPVDIDDESGVLEKNINPYRKGLLGRFRNYRSLVFFDERVEFDSSSNTNLQHNGQLKKFRPYWKFNAANKLMPDTLSSQWVWNQRIRRINASGMELETMDALGVYTAAQYGYAKTLPVAIGTNTRNEEMLFESFEEYNYNEHLNKTKFNPSRKHLDFRQMLNSSLVSTDSLDFEAHTGSNVLAVNAGLTASLEIPFGSLNDAEFANLDIARDTIRNLVNIGGKHRFNGLIPVVHPLVNQGTPTFGNTAFSMTIQPKDTIYPDNRRHHYFSFSDSFYITIEAKNTYQFSVSVSNNYNNTGIAPQNITHSNGLSTYIYDLHGNMLDLFTLTQNGFNYTSATYNVQLCKGTYLVVQNGVELYMAPNNGFNYSTNNYTWQCNNSSSPVYRDLTLSSTCTYYKGIAGSQTMMNPTFRVPQNKEMVFSAWVREACGNSANGIPCKKYTYSSNQVQLVYRSGSDSIFALNPVGPIIEGWQRYEAVFTVPNGINQLILRLLNTGTERIYFDDVRIHPFNANVRSYVYHPVNLRLTSELDENNYARFYEYDEEGVLIRTKVETREGIKTVSETRSAIQTKIK